MEEEKGVWDTIVDFATSLFDTANPFAGINDAADMGIAYKGCNAKVESIPCPTDNPYKADTCEYKKLMLKKKCLETGLIDSTQLALEESMGVGKAGKVISVLYDNVADKEKIYRTTETSKSIDQSIKEANISILDTNRTLPTDSNRTIPIEPNSSIPIEIEPISIETCYSNIPDGNSSDIIKQTDICEDKDHIYQNTGIYPE